MKFTKRTGYLSVFCAGLLFCCFTAGFAQQKRDKGRLHLSVESNMGLYVKDPEVKTLTDDKKYRANTFVNLGYDIGSFRFGVQGDAYTPALLGYPAELKGVKVLHGFASYHSSKIEATLGAFYEQFGSGLLFRVYEDRALGINTAVLGASVRLRPFDWLSLKALAGAPRKYMRYADVSVYGADAEVLLSELLPEDAVSSLSIGGSWLLRDDRSTLEFDHLTPPRVVNGFSGRARLSKGVLTLGGEYTHKGRNMLHDGYGISPNGQALLLDAGVDFDAFGISAQYRTINNISFAIDDRTDVEALSLNYIPSLTKIQKYALLSLFPHSATKNVSGGETGGQIDVFGNLPLWKGDRYPLSFNLNASYFKKLVSAGERGEYKFWDLSGDLSFAEVGLEMEKRWNKRLKTTVVVDWQKSPQFSRLGHGEMKVNTTAIVTDVLYKISPKNSLRMELQHAWSDSKDDQAWIMGLLEWGLSPHWMFYVSDMYNYESTGKNIHYYSVGANFTWNSLRVGCSFGRNREGLQCSGGSCCRLEGRKAKS